MQTIGIHFPCLGGSVTVFLTCAINTFFSPMTWIPPSFPFSFSSSLSVNKLFSYLSLLTTLLPDLLSDLNLLLSILNSDLIITDWLIFILSVHGPLIDVCLYLSIYTNLGQRTCNFVGGLHSCYISVGPRFFGNFFKSLHGVLKVSI